MSSTFRILRPWATLAIGLCVLALGIHWVGLDAVGKALAAQTTPRMALALAAIVAGTILGAWNCYRIAELKPHLTFRSFLPVYWRAWAIGLTVPGQVGDIVSTLWQLRHRTGSLAFVAGRLIADKLITIALVLLLASSLPAALGLLMFPASLLVPLATGLVLIFGVALARWLGRGGPPSEDTSGWRAKVALVVRAANVPPPLLAVNATVTLAKTLLTGVAYWAVLSTVGTHLSEFPTVLAISQSAGLVAYVPVSFNGIGTVEFSAIHLFGIAGYAAPHVLASYVFLRVASLIAAWIPVAGLSLREALSRPGPSGTSKDP